MLSKKNELSYAEWLRETAEEELGVRLAAPVVHVETRLMVVDDGCGEVYQQLTTDNVQQQQHSGF